MSFWRVLLIGFAPAGCHKSPQQKRRARASDGYGVVYSLAELDPAMNDNQIIVADTMNGKALQPNQGPFKVVVPGDKLPARWIRMVNAFEAANALNPSGSLPR